MKVPMPLERSTVPATRRMSSPLGSFTTTDLMRSSAMSAVWLWTSISETANRPISTGTNSTPSVSSWKPKVKRSMPVPRCVPTVLMSTPTAPAMRLRSDDRPLIEASMLSAKTVSAKYSGGRNDTATLASSGVATMKTTSDRRPPVTLETAARPSARPASPRRAMG